LQISAGHQSRRGKAEFRVFTRGSVRTASIAADNATAVSTWSLGFEETKPGTWKVNRISPISVPAGALALPGTIPYVDDSDSRLGVSKQFTGTSRKRAMFGPMHLRQRGSTPDTTQGPK